MKILNRTNHRERVSDLEKRDAALAAANQLHEDLEDFNDSVERLTRRQRWMIAVIVVLVLTLSAVIKVNYDGNVSRCNTGNELRIQIDEKFGSVADALEATQTDLSESDIAFLELLNEDLEPRDCGDINWLGQ